MVDPLCRNAPLLTCVTSTANELTSFVNSALLLGCRVSVAEDNLGIWLTAILIDLQAPQ
jgi:hypothetical protein